MTDRACTGALLDVLLPQRASGLASDYERLLFFAKLSDPSRAYVIGVYVTAMSPAARAEDLSTSAGPENRWWRTFSF